MPSSLLFFHYPVDATYRYMGVSSYLDPTNQRIILPELSIHSHVTWVRKPWENNENPTPCLAARRPPCSIQPHQQLSTPTPTMLRGLRSASRTLLSRPTTTTTTSSSSSSSSPMSTAAALYVTGGGGGSEGMPKYATEMPVPLITKLENGVTVASSYCPSG
jgi:hypothetical protein